jgi:threonine synthase
VSNAIGFKCVECAKEHRADCVEYVCPDCGGNLDVLYDYDRISKQLSKARLAKDRNFTMWRYRSLLPIEDSSPVPPLRVGWTPIYDCRHLADQYGVRQLLIKDDGCNPTASLKDRSSALAVVKAQESGARVITTASSGNAGSALAGMCASANMSSVIFVPERAPIAKIVQLQIYGATVVLVEGSYDDAYDLCLKAARRYGWYQRSTGYNPFMAEGKKTAALEIAEQLNWEVPDKIFVAMGDGCIIGGLWKGFLELRRLGFTERLPQMIGVQSENASALVDAVNGVACQATADTIADSICVSRPRDATKAIGAIRDSGGQGVKVSDESIIAGIGTLARTTGVFVEPAAAATLAGFIKLRESGQVKTDERVLLMLTGSGLKDIASAQRAVKAPLRVRPDLEELARVLRL